MMLRPLSFVTLLAIATAGADCDFSEDTDYEGGDLQSLALHTKEDCCQACIKDSKCAAAVFFGATCYIKDSAKTLAKAAGRWACKPSRKPPAPRASTSFSTRGRKIMIQTAIGEEVFKIRGFSYSNARIGEGPPMDTSSNDYDALMRPKLCQRDFEKMRALNVNAIKVYKYNVLLPDSESAHKGCLDLAWNGGVKPIFISLSIWINGFPMSDAYRADILTRYATMVQETSQHPAVFAYSVGSEFGGDPNMGIHSAYWRDFKSVVSSIRGAMGGAKKLVTTGAYQTTCTSPSLCPQRVLDLGHVINGEAAGADVDFWGVDIYSPNPGAEWLRESIFKATKKPFVLPEYGVSYQPLPTPDPIGKSSQELAFVQQMDNFSYAIGRDGNEDDKFDPDAPIYAGGLLFEWNDEYWKGSADAESLPCNPGLSSAQAWYGKNAVALKSGCLCVAPEQRSAACYLDDLVPRPILAPGVRAIWSKYIPKGYNLGPPSGRCCWGASSRSKCASNTTTCSADAYCDANKYHCIRKCAGMWCPGNFDVFI